MIVNDKDLVKYRGKVTMVDGCFDPLHPGHIRYFYEASKLGYPLLCCVENDANIRLNKKRPPVLTQNDRVQVIDAIRFISFTVCSKTESAEILVRLQPAIYAKGEDWRKKGIPDEEKVICAKFGIKVIYLDTVIDSSTRIVKRFIKKLQV